jgi:hypothetical protein
LESAPEDSSRDRRKSTFDSIGVSSSDAAAGATAAGEGTLPERRGEECGLLFAPLDSRSRRKSRFDSRCVLAGRGRLEEDDCDTDFVSGSQNSELGLPPSRDGRAEEVRRPCRARKDGARGRLPESTRRLPASPCLCELDVLLWSEGGNRCI